MTRKIKKPRKSKTLWKTSFKEFEKCTFIRYKR